MSMGWGAAPWCRLLLVALLALLVPLAAVVIDGDRWLVGPVELSGGDGLIGLAGAATTAAAGLVLPPLPSMATGVVADDVAAAAWTGLTSTDRAPPGLTPSLV